MTLPEFLLARIAEDEELAEGARMWCPADAHEGMDEVPWMDVEWWRSSGLDARHATFSARHNPARTLAECKSKRQIVETLASIDVDESCASSELGYGLFYAVGVLAAVYADHPDYRVEWKY